MTRLSISLDAELAERVRLLAEHECISVSGLIAALLEDSLNLSVKAEIRALTARVCAVEDVLKKKGIM